MSYKICCSYTAGGAPGAVCVCSKGRVLCWSFCAIVPHNQVEFCLTGYNILLTVIFYFCSPRHNMAELDVQIPKQGYRQRILVTGGCGFM